MGLSDGRARYYRLGSAVLLSCLVLAVMFWGLVQIDVPFARFLRSLHLVWLERIGDVGTRLGSGAMLVSLSVGLLLAGWLSTQTRVFEAGWRSLLAHGLAALVAQSLKHAIGRPRPRLIHADNGFPWRPSFESGWDSFPSGHTTASFAVATVMAKFFPHLAGPAYGVAGFVAVSRAIRGSHFATDVMGGVCLGVIAGLCAVHPIRDWKRSVIDETTRLLPYLLSAFSLLWLVTHLPNHVTADFMLLAGALCLLIGIGLRLYMVALGSPSSFSVGRDTITMFIIVGVALTTGLWLVVGLAGLLCVIHWLVTIEKDPEVSCSACSPYSSFRRAIMAEIPLIAGLALTVFFIRHLQGQLPIF